MKGSPMECIPIIATAIAPFLTAIAAIAAAIAAYMSYKVANRHLSFLKMQIVKKQQLSILDKMIEQLFIIQFYLQNEGKISDEEFNSIESLFEKIKVSRGILIQYQILKNDELPSFDTYFSPDVLRCKLDSYIERINQIHRNIVDSYI